MQHVVTRLTHSAVFAVLVVAGGCSSLANPIEQPEVELQRVALASISLTGSATIRADFNVTNPNSMGVPVKAIDYEISIGGGSPFTGRAEVETTIPAYGSAPLTIDLNISAAAAIDTARRLSSGSRDYRIGGVIHFATAIGEISVRFSDEGTIDDSALGG